MLWNLYKMLLILYNCKLYIQEFDICLTEHINFKGLPSIINIFYTYEIMSHNILAHPLCLFGESIFFPTSGINAINAI